MKEKVDRRKPEGLMDYLSLGVTTVGVGYLPVAPGTWGSMVGVAIYLGFAQIYSIWNHHWAPLHGLSIGQTASAADAVFLVIFVLFSLLGVWASNRQ